jgi:putative FmdB family regulatory protein
MPIYEYECGKCRHHFDIKQGFDDEARAECPRCQGKAKRVIHASPVIFKGSGFYVTDHRPAEVKNPASEPGKTKKEPSSGKSESKKEPSAGKGKSESAASKSE